MLKSPLQKARRVRPAAAVFTLLLLAKISSAAILTTIGHNLGESESPNFTFTNVPPPSRSDAATAAQFTIVSGEADASGGGLEVLHDGKVPSGEDDPAENFFFAAGTEGGRIQVDLGRVRELKQINTYSWHPSTRGPQVYKLYASEGTTNGFMARPATDADLENGGWKLIARVDTRIKGGDNRGQYGVSISDSTGSIGKYRYLLFNIAPTETDDDFGNTFYSEMDVVELSPAAEADILPAPAPMVVRSADGYCEISLDTAKAPELREWAEQKLAPALVEWYPKIVAMLSSDGFTAPTNFSVVLRPIKGVAFTSGTRIVANSTWLAGELKGEAVGSIIHEAVHVVQQYGDGRRGEARTPGWITEGLPDYIRFFKFEPQSHGADSVWLRKLKRVTLNYDGMYRISANFLDYVVEHHDPDKKLIQKVNAACQQGTYTDGLWKDLTGESLADLNSEWKTAVHSQLANSAGADNAAPTDMKKADGANPK
jgi:Peptidase of plants and bacteria